MIISFEEALSQSLSEMIEQEHNAYEEMHGVKCNYTPFCFTASEGDEICGAINGYTCYCEIYIDDLIVFPHYRNKGIGRKLICTVEQHFATKFYHNINLVTNAFQAPQFYEKCGFTLEFTRLNAINPLLTKHFYCKLLNCCEANQGAICGKALTHGTL